MDLDVSNKISSGPPRTIVHANRTFMAMNVSAGWPGVRSVDPDEGINWINLPNSVKCIKH